MPNKKNIQERFKEITELVYQKYQKSNGQIGIWLNKNDIYIYIFI